MPKQSSRLTIQEVARLAGVSPSTVSRVLSGTTPVAADKRADVLAVVKRLKYRPNVVAQGLARGRSGAVGVLAEDMASPFYGEVNLGIEEGLKGSAYHPVFASANRGAQGEIEVLLARRVDALIVLSQRIPDQAIREVARQLPLVVVERMVSGLEDRCVRVDNVKGAHVATRYLIELGHTKIAHIAGPSSQADATDRRHGYARALAEAGLAADPRWIVEGDFSERSGLMAMEALISRTAVFTAVFVANDQMAYGARLALFRRGIRVPEEVSLVGFDDQRWSAFATPPLTTIRQPVRQMGLVAADAVLHLLRKERFAIPQLATELVVRESAGTWR